MFSYGLMVEHRLTVIGNRKLVRNLVSSVH